MHDGCQRVHCLTSRYPPSFFCISSSCQSLNLAWKARGLQDAYAEETAFTRNFEIWSYLCTSTPCARDALAVSDCYQTDHMLVIPWKLSQGWGTPEIKPCTSHACMHVFLAIDYDPLVFFSPITQMALCHLIPARPCSIMPSASSKG